MGWKNEWIAPYEFYKSPNREPDSTADSEKHASWKNYREFVEKWSKSESKMKIPSWYKFNPEDTNGIFHGDDAHNSLKKMDETMFNFLKEKQWQEKIDAEETENKQNKYTEKSYFVVDCRQLLGIGGEAIVIRKCASEKVFGYLDGYRSKPPWMDYSTWTEIHAGREYVALKIIPIDEHNFENGETMEMMKHRIYEEAYERSDEKSFATNYMKKSENLVITDDDIEIADSRLQIDFKHDSLMEYSNLQLDFINVFGKKVFVRVIGEFQIFILQMQLILVMPVYDISLWDFLEYASHIENQKSGNEEFFPLKERLDMSLRICDGLLHLNCKKDVAHRDIKLRSVIKIRINVRE